jgi:hypothetical protein
MGENQLIKKFSAFAIHTQFLKQKTEWYQALTLFSLTLTRYESLDHSNIC